MSLHQLLSILRARIATAGLILLVVLALALAWILVRAPSYKANAPVLSDVKLEYSGDLAIMRFRVRVPASGGKKKVDATGLEVYRVVNGRIRSNEAYWKQVSWPDAK